MLRRQYSWERRGQMRKPLTVRTFEGGIHMPLFERGYKAAARTELERDIRRIEEKDKKAQTKEDFEEASAAVKSNLNFAERLNLISVEQANDYRDRVEKANQKFLESVAENIEDQEQQERYMSMQEAQSEIAREKTNTSDKQTQSEQAHSTPNKEEDDGSRTH